MEGLVVTYLGDVAQAIRDEVPPSLIPDEPADSLFLIYAVLALAKGTLVTAEDVHNGWSAWMIGRGQEHESIVPYTDLPDSTRREDDPFVLAIRRVAERNKFGTKR
jgi:hypothetical protein